MSPLLRWPTLGTAAQGHGQGQAKQSMEGMQRGIDAAGL